MIEMTIYKAKSANTKSVYAFDAEVANFHRGHTIKSERRRHIATRIIVLPNDESDLRNLFAIIKKIEPHNMRLLPFSC